MNSPSIKRQHKRLRQTLSGLLIPLLLSAGQLQAEIVPGGPYDRSVAYIGGLSRQLFGGDRNDVTIATEMFFNEVIKRIGHQKAEFKVLDNIPAIIKAMREDRLDTIFANPIDYLELDQQINPDLRYTLSYGPVPEQRVLLLTSSLHPITDIRALRGKRLSIPDGYILGMTFLEVNLAKAGLPPPDRFFSSIQYPKSSNAAVLDVFFDKADLAVTSDVAYNLANELNPQLHAKLDILTISDPYIPFIIGVNKQVPHELTDPVDEILLDLSHEPKLRHILSLFSATNVVKVRSEQLQTLRTLKKEHDALITHK